MALTRRQTLSILGGGTILAATGGAFAVTRTPATALAPWTAAGGYDEPRMRALSYAILAPNPHNRQPWMVDLAEPGQVTLYVDTERLLPHTDPFNRQIVIGLGCFLEMLRLAAAEDGYRVTFDLFPDGSDGGALDDRRVAVARFEEGGVAESVLFAQVPHRRTLKEPFDMTRTVAPEVIETLKAVVANGSVVSGSVDPDHVEELRVLTTRALEIEIETPLTYKESVDLFRIGHREVNANPDGIDFSGPVFEAMHLTGTFSRDVALDRSSVAFQEGLKAVLANSQTAMGHFWQVTPGNSRADQIRAGQDWLRLHLAATGLGLGVQPLSQALQEYPEMAALYAQVHERLAPGGGTVQMLARVGYGPEVPVSPRWPLEAKIIDG